jgi:hypothetical protein
MKAAAKHKFGSDSTGKSFSARYGHVGEILVNI